MAEKQAGAGHPSVKKPPLAASLSRPWLVILLVVMIYLGANIIRSYYRTQALLVKLKTTKEEVIRQQEINRQMKAKLIKLEDKQEVARLARERLGLVKEGEVVYKIMPKEKK